MILKDPSSPVPRFEQPAPHVALPYNEVPRALITQAPWRHKHRLLDLEIARQEAHMRAAESKCNVKICRSQTSSKSRAKGTHWMRKASVTMHVCLHAAEDGRRGRDSISDTVSENAEVVQ
eukprot:191922-Rhodomonas_salina.1